MKNLILAELYKESRKKSFKVFVLLIIFVSILCLVFINKNVTIDSGQVINYPQYSQEEYESVNKYGNYQQYLEDYDKYEKVVNREINKNNSSKESKLNSIFKYYPSFLFVLGLIVIFISFHILSYDYQNKSLRYVFMSDKGRLKVLFSKLITIGLLTIFFSMIIFFVFLVMLLIFSKDNIFLEVSYIYIGNSLKVIPTILYYFVKTFIYIIPIFFMGIVTVFLVILFKGSTFALIISNVVYFCSLLISQFLITYGYTFVRYTFLPYLDLTYYESPTTVALNNLIYNTNLSLCFGLCLLFIYSIIFVIGSVRFIKRDI